MIYEGEIKDFLGNFQSCLTNLSIKKSIPEPPVLLFICLHVHIFDFESYVMRQCLSIGLTGGGLQFVWDPRLTSIGLH